MAVSLLPTDGEMVIAGLEMVITGLEELGEIAEQTDSSAATKPRVDDGTIEVCDCRAGEIAQMEDEQTAERELVWSMLAGINPSDA